MAKPQAVLLNSFREVLFEIVWKQLFALSLMAVKGKIMLLVCVCVNFCQAHVVQNLVPKTSV